MTALPPLGQVSVAEISLPKTNWQLAHAVAQVDVCGWLISGGQDQGLQDQDV